MKKTIPYFGTIDLASPDEDYDGEFELDGSAIPLSLHIGNDGKTIPHVPLDEGKLQDVVRFLENLPRNIENAKAAYLTDYENDGIVKDLYIGNHVSDFADDCEDDDDEPGGEADSPAGAGGTAPTMEERMLSAMHLVTISLHPLSDDSFAVIDFTFDESLTDDVLAVKLDKDGKVEAINIES